MSWPNRVRTILGRSRRPMSLSAILDELAKEMSFEGVQDPLHNLRGVTTKGVKDGWLERVERGVFELADKRRRKPARAVDASPSYESVEKPMRAPRRRLRRTRKAMEITVGNITLKTPSGMQPETLARLVQAIRSVS